MAVRFCTPSWALKSPELTALSRGCCQPREKKGGHFFFFFFLLCLFLSPAVRRGFASWKDGQIKSSSFFQILSPNHPSASSSPPHSPRRFTGSPGESAGISIFNKELLGRDGSRQGGGQGNSSQSLARPWPGTASVGLALGGNPKKHQGAMAQTYFKPITTNHLILWWHCSRAHV